FAALLGTPAHGRWLLGPAVPIKRARRRYRSGTLVLETEYEVAGGAVRVTDCMPPRSDTPDLVRMVEGVRGHVPMRLERIMPFDYGAIVPWVRRIDGGIRATAGPDALVLFSDAELRGEGLTTVASFEVAEGQRVEFDLAWHPSHQPPPARCGVAQAICDTTEW